MEGWIKIHRKILEWEWYNDNNTKIVFLHLLLTANHKEKKWKGITILRGQKLTSLQHLAEETNLTIQQVRTSLNKLKSTNEITIKTTNKNTLVTIEKYNNYQDTNEENNKQINKQINNQITNEQQTNNKQITTNKNEKNEKNDKNIYLMLFNKYKERIRAIKYWSEKIILINQLRNEQLYLGLSNEQQDSIVEELMCL